MTPKHTFHMAALAAALLIATPASWSGESAQQEDESFRLKCKSVEAKKADDADGKTLYLDCVKLRDPEKERLHEYHEKSTNEFD